ncbi:putative signal transduction protein with EFhand domain protein [Pseudodesulfovibrio mercurii]|uniref:Putative signal transduction protein with EFhand domain protein n=1 Tax=Pseudodesulfovibrio mercurii TaxID=641491 RepID=F0JFK9_9BACT|nr:EF-hand domain-containing protein [Pseudodesulfovibrio mercurii]EGB14933.1 putative signal transduction protein with EFhand domain protein [Pseudodesulfovibrio mercurii]
MSISAVSGSSSSFGLAEMMQVRRKEPDPDEMAASIVEKDDQDGDGFLSLAETPLDEDRFNEIDADGDGLISADELSADAQEHMSEAPTGMAGMAMGGSAGSQSSSGSGSSDESSDEEYDQYDLNEDGVVTLDELMQALNQGDTSVQALFQNMDGGSSALIQRLASEAYQAQMEA